MLPGKVEADDEISFFIKGTEQINRDSSIAEIKAG